MTKWKKLQRLERRLEASELWPQLGRTDNKKLNIRKILIERYELGIHRLTVSQIQRINEIGYDKFVIERMNEEKKIGASKYKKLVELGRLDITLEYIMFHNYRDELKKECRTKIAKLLAGYIEKYEI